MVVRVHLSSIEIERLASEIAPQVVGSRVQNAYLLPDGSYTIRLRREGVSWELQLLPESLLVLVKGTFEERAEPDGFCRALREHLRGRTLTSLDPFRGERAISIGFEGGLRLCCELYPGGRILLLGGPEGEVLAAYPPLKSGEGLTGPCVSRAEVKGMPSLGEVRSAGPSKKLGSVLVRELGIAPKYANEALHRSGLRGDVRIGDLTEEQLEGLRATLGRLLEEARSGRPRIYLLTGRVELSLVRLTHLESEAVEVREFEGVNEAVLEYLRIAVEQLARSAKAREAEEKARRMEKELEEKLALAASLGQEAEELRRAAQAIFTGAAELERLRLSRTGSVDLGTLRAEVRGNALEVDVCGRKLLMGLSEPVTRQVSSIFDKAKGLEEARRNVLAEAEALRKEIERVRREAMRAEAPKAVTVRPSRPKQWYESYRWTFTTSGKLVVAGRDASSNVRLLKKHMEPGDLVFHAEVRGSPAVLLKGGASEESDVVQAATFCASYSRAWREGLGSVSVYYVRPEQVSFTPPPGTYLEKGSFVVKPPKNYLIAELKLAIGLTGDGRVVSGHPDYVRSVADAYLVLRPGRKPARELVAELLREVERAWGTRPDEDVASQLVALVPYGVGEVVELKVSRKATGQEQGDSGS